MTYKCLFIIFVVVCIHYVSCINVWQYFLHVFISHNVFSQKLTMSQAPVVTISRLVYAHTFGPTVGDKVGNGVAAEVIRMSQGGCRGHM